MAKIINNLRYQRISNKRDRALEKIKFNESYINIAEQELKENSDIKIAKEDTRMRRMLLPLEKKSASQKENTQYLFEKALDKLNEKQRLPRLAVEQTYNRKLDKSGKKAAKEYRENALAKLDNKQDELKDKWAKRVKEASNQRDIESLDKYEKEQSERTQALEMYKEEVQQINENKFAGLKQKVKKADDALAQKVEEYNIQLKALSKDSNVKMEKDNAVLEVRDLVMLFDGLRAVDKLNFDVKEGEIFGLIGPNGAGKTTVFNCITQFNKPTSGSIYYRDVNDEVVDVIQKKVHDIVKLGIVRTFQNLELIWELSVLDNMLIGAHSLYGANFIDHILHTRKLKREDKIMRAKALDVLERLNLTAYKDVIPYGLPYGILKRIELARTLMVNPRLIILDEPAAGLNEAETEELAKIIRKIREDYNCTVFLVEHDMGLVMDICDTVCAISFGKKLAIGTPSEIQDNKLVQEAYLGGTMTEGEDE